ncbi:coiled-coil domain-containing protein 73-like [Toxotes jaculatrix]|uniref:coiled-coil domain-containing protein 73-like n=1 Tax=Toxotes jaculatrix TaxID=941984 RepID=UPI001B3A8CBB|nr:coiled-coil domain-containing protein 73-like [Toxotes jaculatrix]
MVIVTREESASVGRRGGHSAPIFSGPQSLLKYNLEKKSNELEQKLALQSRTKDSHLSQLGEVEKRFSVLSRQCAMVKQAHEKLEQNVDEAMRINKKLTSANEKQEATIVSLKKVCGKLPQSPARVQGPNPQLSRSLKCQSRN